MSISATRSSINFTGRKDVSPRDVNITVELGADGGNPRFNAVVELGRYGLPGNALVFIEAYRKSQRVRFPFGTVGALVVPAEDQRQLGEFDPPEGILFRLKVTDPENGMLLAAVDRIRSGNEDEISGGRSLLPIEPRDLAQECWRVSFSETTGPVFMIHRDLPPSWREASKSWGFRALVYPAVLREILNRILREESYSDSGDDNYWMGAWLRFAANNLRAGNPPVADDEGRNDSSFIEEVDDWIDRAVSEFCRITHAFDRMTNRRED